MFSSQAGLNSRVRLRWEWGGEQRANFPQYNTAAEAWWESRTVESGGDGPGPVFSQSHCWKRKRRNAARGEGKRIASDPNDL
jgi:hypothetical protein